VQLIGAEIIWRRCVRRTLQETGEILDRSNVRLLGFVPRPRIRMSSIIRSRSGVVLSSVMGTSCQQIEKVPIVRQVRPSSKSTVKLMRHHRHKRPYCESGFVLV
jgi:hypothetical protein